MWAFPEREKESWIHISYIEGENTKNTTLASESEIYHKLKSDLKKKAKINFVEDKSIVSGCIVKLGSTMIDLSLKSKLDKIINSLR